MPHSTARNRRKTGGVVLVSDLSPCVSLAPGNVLLFDVARMMHYARIPDTPDNRENFTLQVAASLAEVAERYGAGEVAPSMPHEPVFLTDRETALVDLALVGLRLPEGKA